MCRNLLRSNSSISSSSRFSSLSTSTGIRECNNKIVALERENFDLRLRIYLLEEKLSHLLLGKHRMIKGEVISEEISDDYTERQLLNCKESLRKCVKLVEEAADHIEHLENDLEKKQSEIELIKSNECHKETEADIYFAQSVILEDENSDVEDNSSVREESDAMVTKAYFETVQYYRIVLKRFENTIAILKACWKDIVQEFHLDIHDDEIIHKMEKLFCTVDLYYDNLP